MPNYNPHILHSKPKVKEQTFSKDHSDIAEGNPMQLVDPELQSIQGSLERKQQAMY